jgi:hypothetical protein
MHFTAQLVRKLTSGLTRAENYFIVDQLDHWHSVLADILSDHERTFVRMPMSIK